MPVLKNMDFDSKCLIKILHACVRSTELFSGEEVGVGLHCTSLDFSRCARWDAVGSWE